MTTATITRKEHLLWKISQENKDPYTKITDNDPHMETPHEGGELNEPPPGGVYKEHL